MISQFLMSPIQGFMSGDHSVKASLAAIVGQMGVSRIYLLTTPSLTKTPYVEMIAELLGSKLVAVFSESLAHTPESVVERAQKIAVENDVDCLLSFGGSSVVDLTKAVALTLAEGNDYPLMKVSFSSETGPVIPPLNQPKLPHIAIPTTLSSSEYSFAVAITEDSSGEKNIFADLKLAPRWVFQDAQICLATPDRLWAASGMKIFSDCLEMLCSPRAVPFTDALALGGMELLHHNLPKSLASKDAEARANCLAAGGMALSFAHNVSFGLVAALRHQLGGHQKVSHGEASTVVLPHVLEWNLDAIKSPLARAAEHLGLCPSNDKTQAALAMIDAVRALTKSLGLPRTLKELGVEVSALAPIAEHAAVDIAAAGNPRRISSSADVLGILKAAY